MKFLKDFKMFSILENKKQALSILRRNNINSNNSDYIEIYQNLEDNFFNLNLLGLLTKYRFTQNVSQDEILDLIRWLSENNGNKLLSKPILKYDKFQDLKDEILYIDKIRKIKLIINKLPHHQKYLYKNATPIEMETFENWCVKMFEIKYQEPFFRKISKIKSMTELIDHISQFVEQNLNIKSFKEKIKEIESTEGADIYRIDEENGIICAVIHDYNASSKLGSRAWCISTSIGSWRNYNSEKMSTIQYFIWNYSLSISDPLFMIGVTVSINDTIKNIHDNNDNSLNSLINYRDKKVKFVLDLNLKGVSYEKYLLNIKNAKEKKRKENKDIYEESPELLKLANALMHFLIDFNKWSDDYVIYDITPIGGYYDLYLFEAPNDIEFAIGTDEEAESSARQSVHETINEYGHLYLNSLRNNVDEEKLIKSIIESEIEIIIDEIREDEEFLKIKNDKEELYEILNKIKNEVLDDIEYFNKEETEDLKSIRIQIEYLESGEEKNIQMDENILKRIEKYLIDERVREFSNEVESDPFDFLIERYDEETVFDIIIKYVDIEEYVTDVLYFDGRGVLSPYDGLEHYIEYEDTEYYIYYHL